MLGEAWARRLLGSLAAGLALAIITAWVYSSYFQIDVAASLVWSGSDGYCDPDRAGMGTHCFSDYSQFTALGTTMDPEGSNPFIRNYPPINRAVFWLFQLLHTYVSPILALAAYVSVITVAMLVPALWSARFQGWSQRMIIVLLVGIGTYPFLAAVDRGNNIALAIPLVLWAFVAMRTQNFPQAVIAVALAAQIKPQFGLLVIAFLVVRQWRYAVIAAVSASGLFLASFALFLLPGIGLDPIWEFKYFLLYTRYYSDYLPSDSVYPVNASFSHSVSQILGWVGIHPGSSQVFWIVSALVILGVVAIVWRGNTLPFPLWAGALLMAISLTPAVTFGYYFAGALVIAALITNQRTGIEAREPAWLMWLLLCALTLSLAPILISIGEASSPLPVASGGVVISLVPILGSSAWLVLLAATAIRAARPRLPIAHG